jgi:hypothetical protein
VSADNLIFKHLPYQVRSRLNEFTGAELKVWICLLSHANSKHDGKAFPGISLMVRETGLSKHGVDNAIGGLKDKGWIVRSSTYSRATGQRTAASTWCKWAPAISGSHWERIMNHVSKSGAR